MAVKTISSPFGSETRTRVLLMLQLLGSSFPRELSRVLGSRVSVVSKALAGLERDALVSGRLAGRTRVYTLNPAYFAKGELQAYLSRLADADADLRGRAAQLRRRPLRRARSTASHSSVLTCPRLTRRASVQDSHRVPSGQSPSSIGVVAV